MKKICSIILVAAIAIPALAADRMTPAERAERDYSSWLPAQGDFSVGFSLDPLATYVGNFFNGKTNNTLDDWGGEPLINSSILGLKQPMVSIMGTYMLTNTLAAKLNVGFGISSLTKNEYVLDEQARFLDPFSRDKVTDSYHFNQSYGSLAFGLEYRVGKTLPVQGVFGAGINYAFGSKYERYAYGNAITELIQTPGKASSYKNVAGYMPKARVLTEQSPDLIHMVGLYGSVGVEWFVAPKIALGANVNVGLYYAINPASEITYEGWNIQSMQLENFTEKVQPASHEFHFGTDNIGANLYISFYFR